MKTKIAVTSIALAVLVSSITGCTPKNSYLIKILKLAPEDTVMVTCMDVQAMTQDPDFKNVYGIIDFHQLYEMLGIDLSNVSAVATLGTFFPLVVIGDFNREDIRNILIEQDGVEGEYMGVEIWTGDGDLCIAFMDDVIIVGDVESVEACIRSHKNEDPSLYDNKNMKSVVDKLPASVFSTVMGPDYIHDIRVLAGGICLHNLTSGDGVCDITGWFKFDSEVSAVTAMEEGFEDDISMDLDFTIVDAHLRGQFIEINGEREIPED